MRRLAILLVLVTACGGKKDDAPPAPPVAPSSGSSSEPYPMVGLPAQGNGAYWNAAAHVLLIDTPEGVVQWSDDAGAKLALKLAAPAPEKVSLGALTVTGDGDIVSASFGFGDKGTIYMWSKGTLRGLDKLDGKRRRIGLTRAPDGTLYDTYFVVDGKVHTGGIAKVDLTAGTETDVVTNLKKPVGIAVTADTILVGDQETGEVSAYPLADPTKGKVVGKLDSLDVFTLLPDGDVVTGGKDGKVRRIHPADGKVTDVAAGFAQVRGTAYDPDKHRLFVIEHGSPKGPRFHIVPL